MDAQQPQGSPLAAKSQADPDVSMDGHHPQDSHSDPSAVPETPKPGPSVETSEESTPTTSEGGAKGADISDTEVETPTEPKASRPQPASPGPSTPTKNQQRPTSTRASDEIFKTPPNPRRHKNNTDGDEDEYEEGDGDGGVGSSSSRKKNGGKDKDKRISRASDTSKSTTSSASSADSNEENRLSDKVKRAWREARGQSRCRDPLEQWMVKHSGGTFKEKPRGQMFGESPEK